MPSATEHWEQLLMPAVMRERLISVSLCFAAFEILKKSIIGRIRSFYMVEFDVDGDFMDGEYETSVLSRNKNPLLACFARLAVRERGAKRERPSGI
jgi:hypothetical protein